MSVYLHLLFILKPLFYFEANDGALCTMSIYTLYEISNLFHSVRLGIIQHLQIKKVMTRNTIKKSSLHLKIF